MRGVEEYDSYLSSSNVIEVKFLVIEFLKFREMEKGDLKDVWESVLNGFLGFGEKEVNKLRELYLVRGN